MKSIFRFRFDGGSEPCAVLYVDHKNVPTYTNFYMLITNMATVRNFVVISDTFNVHVNYVQKGITELL
jgi:hypothetical protein